MKPFVDRPSVDISKNISRATPKQTYSEVSNSHLDGSSVKTIAQFSKKTVFTSVQDYGADGTVSHDIKQMTFGQIEDGVLGLTPFTDRLGKTSPVNYLNQPPPQALTSYNGTILVDMGDFNNMPVVDNGVDPGFRDGRIDVMGTLDSIPYISVEGDQIAKGVRGSTLSMSDRGDVAIGQTYSLINPGRETPYFDSSDFGLTAGDFVLSRPGLINDVPGINGAFVESFGERVGDFYFLTDRDYGLIPSGSRSAGAGFTYGNSEPGTDSVAFGGFKR